MRILHLIDARGWPDARGSREAVDAAFRACAILRREASPGCHPACILGAAPVERAAAALGAPTTDRLHGPAALPVMARGPLRRFVLDRGVPDVLACWGVGAARLARSSLGDVVPRLVCLADEPENLAVAGSLLQGSTVLTLTPSAHAAARRAGAAPEALIAARPPAAAGDAGGRDACRRALRLRPEDVAIAHIGMGRRADATRFVFLIGFLGVAGVRAVGVMSAHAAQSARAQRFHRTLVPPSRLILSGEPGDAAIAACDLGVYEGGGAGPSSAYAPAPGEATMAIASAHGLGIPVVAPSWASDGSPYPASLTEVLLAHNGTIPELVRKILPLAENAGARRAVSEAVLAHARSARFAERFVETFDGACAIAARRLRS